MESKILHIVGLQIHSNIISKMNYYYIFIKKITYQEFVLKWFKLSINNYAILNNRIII